MTHISGVILDVDGTLVDSNDAHATAWITALAENGYDVMQITLKKAGLPSDRMLMIGDTAYDIEAAKKVQVGTIAFRSGGWSDSDLAGAIAIYDGPADLLAHYDETRLVR